MGFGSCGWRRCSSNNIIIEEVAVWEKDPQKCECSTLFRTRSRVRRLQSSSARLVFSEIGPISCYYLFGPNPRSGQVLATTLLQKKGEAGRVKIRILLYFSADNQDRFSDWKRVVFERNKPKFGQVFPGVPSLDSSPASSSILYPNRFHINSRTWFQASCFHP